MLCPCLALYDDIDNDGGTHERRDGAKWDDASFARQEADEIAEQGDGRATEQGGRQQCAMVVGGKKHACYVWHCQSDEGDGSAEGGGDGSEDARDDEQDVASAPDADAEVLSIAVA